MEILYQKNTNIIPLKSNNDKKGEIEEILVESPLFTKKQMMNQIEKAQSVPKTASRSGSAEGGDISHEDAVFSAIKGMDETLDNLFW